MKLKVGQWVGFESISRDRTIIGKVVEASSHEVVVETQDSCEPGETRRVTFGDDAPWMPSRIQANTQIQRGIEEADDGDTA